MKILLTAVAALALAGTAYAQQTPAPATPPATDATSATPAAAPASRDAAAEAAGGYTPAQPALSAPPAPGADVIAAPSPPVDQAFPAPAPRKSYPWCSRTIRDECRQRGG